MGKLANLARMTVSSAPGTGSSIALGSAVAGHITFANAGISNGDVITYAIRDGSNSEIGTATYSTTGPSLTGRTVLNSTNSNAAINATASAEVFITISASDMNEKLALTGGNLLTIYAGWPTLKIRKSGNGESNQLIGYSHTNFPRWSIQLGDGTTETGTGNSGSNFAIDRFGDTGSYLDTPIAINRATGLITLAARPKFGSATPWDDLNFDPATKANVASPVFSGIASFSTSATLAAAGTTQGTATAITKQVSIVTTGTGGVILPAGLPVGTELKVANANFSAINVYPHSGATIGPLATNAAFSLPSGACLTFLCGSATYWFPPAATFV